MSTPSVADLAAQWLQWDRNPKTRHEIEQLVADKNEARLEQLLRTRLEFGTAGLRAAMGAGNSRMNDVTVIQAAQGLAAFLKTSFPQQQSPISIVIGHDARHNSERFAALSVNVFLAAGFHVHSFRQIVPTPFVPFAVRHFHCQAGVMVTASHNPKEDNGYKVYWDNGAQIISPIDSGIAAAIEANLEPLPSSWERENTSLQAVESFDEIFTHYFSSLGPLCHFRELNVASKLRFTYTAMHGVGTQFTTESLRRFGIEGEALVYVKEQVQPDPDFPTVAFPNPEEGKSALNLSFAAADAHGSRVILANDPDADRLAVAEKQRDGTWRVFTGNHIGALLGWWNLFLHKAANQGSVENVAMLSSAVSSMILRSIAEKEKFYFEETLTGFKWMGSRSEKLMTASSGAKKVLFAFEEAIGFMCGTRVYDKDGVTAAAVLAEMANYLESREGGKLLSEKLDDIYAEYGRHTSYNSYVISRNPTKSKEMFDTMRTLNDGHYPKTVAGANVLHIRDLTIGYDSRQEDKKPLLPSSAVSPMITFYFDNGVTLTIRGSGTEPKLKWYSELISNGSSSAENTLEPFVNRAVEELMRPQQFGFTARPT